MPVVDPVIVSILPNDGESIRAHRDHISDPRGGCLSELDIEHSSIRFGSHVLVSAAAGGTGTGRPQQLKWIDARMIVVPCDRKFSGLFIGSDAGWFFVHR